MRRLNIHSFSQFIVIMIIFAITGSLSLYITVELFQFIGLQEENLNPIIFDFGLLSIRFPGIFIRYNIWMVVWQKINIK